MKILVCAECNGSDVAGISFELIGAAREVLGAEKGEVVAFCAGESPQNARDLLGAADRLIFGRHAAQPMIAARDYGEAVLDVIGREKPDLTIVPYTANGLDVAPFVAARAGLLLASYVVSLVQAADGVEASSQIYGGKVRAATKLLFPAVVMINSGSFDEAAAARVVDDRLSIIDLPPTGSGIRLEKVDMPNLAEINLAGAERIVCVGRGIGDEASIERARQLANLLGAELAGSRPVVDRGWLPKQRQVGKSGQKVKPKLYLALGVSGAPEHLEGMSKSGMIVAVNTDPKAPIFHAAHYAATCDLFELIDSLSARLQTAKPS